MDELKFALAAHDVAHVFKSAEHRAPLAFPYIFPKGVITTEERFFLSFCLHPIISNHRRL